MKKFSKLIESVDYTEEDIEDLFLPLLDIGAKVDKIYDGYFKDSKDASSSVKFFQTMENLNKLDRVAKLVIIEMGDIGLESVEVENWREIKNSSGFFFQSKESFIKYRSIINDIYGCLSHLKYDYMIDVESGYIRVILIGDYISEEISKKSQDILEAYNHVFEELSKLDEYFIHSTGFFDANTETGKFKISFEFNKIRLKYRLSSKKLVTALSSITKFNPDYDRSFGGSADKPIPEIVNIMKKVDDMGLKVYWRNDSYNDKTYTIHICPK